MSGVRMLHFLKDWSTFIQIHQYYTMALKLWGGLTGHQSVGPEFFTLAPRYHESQKGTITIQRGSIENQKGAIAIYFVQR